MSLDLILEFAHHLCVFGIIAIAAAEFAMIVPGLSGERLNRLGVLDGLYGGAATLVIVVGFLRVFFGDAGSAFYISNPVFWTKIGLFVVMGLLSVPPTLAIMGWRRAAKADPAFTVPAEGIARARRFIVAEFVVFAFIPIAAAMMARGIGL
jgi:putative membrane protein